MDTFESEPVWTPNPDIFNPDDATRSIPVPYREINSQDGCRGLHGACSVTSVSLRSPEHYCFFTVKCLNCRSSSLVKEFTLRFPGMSLHNVLSEFSLPAPLSEHSNPLGLPQQQVCNSVGPNI